MILFYSIYLQLTLVASLLLKITKEDFKLILINTFERSYCYIIKIVLLIRQL